MSFASKKQKLNPKSQDVTEKRYLPRWTVNKKVECIEIEADGSYAQRSVTKDLSFCGASIFLFQAPKDNNVGLRIYLNSDQMINVSGQIVWRKSFASGEVVGISFQDVPEDVQRTILNHAFELDTNEVK